METALALLNAVIQYLPMIIKGAESIAELAPEAITVIEKLWNYIELGWNVVTGKQAVTPEIQAQIDAALDDVNNGIAEQAKLREAEAAALVQTQQD